MSRARVITPTARATASGPVYAFGPFRLDASRRELTRDGIAVPLSAKVMDTLLVLVRHHDRLVTKEELIAAVWHGAPVTDDSLVLTMSMLRRSIGDDVTQPTYIATLARRGYRFVAPIVEHADPLPDAHQGAPGAHRPRAPIAALVIGVVLVAAAAIGWGREHTTGSSTAAVRFYESMPSNEALLGSVIVSPDGRALAFSAQNRDGVSRLWVRPLDATQAHPLRGTEGATAPFWSPDSQFLGFVSDGEIKRVGLATGSIQTIVTTHRVSPVGASWGLNDVVLYGDLGKIFSVPASGGTPKVEAGAAEPDDIRELQWPQMLPDGRHFLFFGSGASPETGGTFLATLGSTKRMLLVPGYRATFAPPDRILYVRDRTLMVQHLDVDRGRLDGSPMSIPGDVPASAQISASANGTVLAITAGTARQRLVWFDRRGNQLSTVNAPPSLVDVALSPNGRQALTATREAGSYALWLIDLERDVSTKVAMDGTYPAWAPDGARFAYTVVGAEGADLYVQSTASAAPQHAWLKTKELKAVNSWTPDGRFVVFSKYTTRDQTSQDLWLLPAGADNPTPIPYLQTRARERDGRVSPDCRWIAFTSDETGTSEIYVQSFPTPGFKVRVSTGGGTQPLWRRDGRELFYVSNDHHVVSVGLSPGADFRPRVPEPLFALPPVPMSLRQVDVSADGQRFLAIDWDVAGQENDVVVFTNWRAAQQP